MSGEFLFIKSETNPMSWTGKLSRFRSRRKLTLKCSIFDFSHIASVWKERI